MARRFVTYNTEDQKAGRVNVDHNGVMKPGGTGTGLPSDVGAYKYMATDGEGNWVAADSLAYTTKGDDTVLDNQELAFDDRNVYSEAYVSNVATVEVGDVLTVVWDGVEYKDLVAYYSEWYGDPAIGNEHVVDEDYPDNGIPFYIAIWESDFDIYTHTGTNVHSVKIIADGVKTIDPKWLNLNIAKGIGKNSNVLNGGAPENASGECSNAEGQKTQAAGDYSHAEGYQSKALGQYSHAEGLQGEAKGGTSHVEGSQNVAIGSQSHAEGWMTEAAGECSHSEGYRTRSYGDYSHAEGNLSVAGGSGAHAEGEIIKGTYYNDVKLTGEAGATVYTLSSSSDVQRLSKGTVFWYNGKIAIALAVDETQRTVTLDKTLSEDEQFQKRTIKYYEHVAYGRASHVEGGSSLALQDHQHVEGKYNEADLENKYVHIVGNGTSQTDRSNAHTLDWDGNAWFAGGVELTSPNGTRYRFTVSDDGTLSGTVVTE